MPIVHQLEWGHSSGAVCGSSVCIQGQWQVLFPVFLSLHIGLQQLQQRVVKPLDHPITLQVIGCGVALLHPKGIPCALDNAAFKVLTLVQVNDFWDTVCAEQLDQFCCDPYGCLVWEQSGICPFGEVVLYDQKITGALGGHRYF